MLRNAVLDGWKTVRRREEKNGGKKLVLSTFGRHGGNSVAVRVVRKQRGGHAGGKESVLVGMEVATSRIAVKNSVSTSHLVTCE